MANNHPIGIFDSGLGGLTIWKYIHQLLPGESTLYLADSKYAPYGNRSQSEIVSLSKKNMDYLIEKGPKMVVVACNTATTNAIDVLRRDYQIPIVGIEPAIKPAALNSKTGVVGVLATRGTLASSLFIKTTTLYAHHRKVVEQFGDGLVPLIEEGKIESPEMRELLMRYTQPMVEAGMDYLVLGCTHYSFLIPLLEELLPSGVQIIDSGAAIARQTQRILEGADMRANGTSPHFEFYSNKDTRVMKEILLPSTFPYIIETIDF